jgi:hypothetical protein
MAPSNNMVVPRFPPERFSTLVSTLEAWIETHRVDARILCMTSLSTFFDPPPSDSRRSSLVLNGIVHAALVGKNEETPIIATFVEARDATVIRFLRGNGVPVYDGPMDQMAGIKRFLDDIRRDRLGRLGDRSANPAERWLLDMTEQAAGLRVAPDVRRMFVDAGCADALDEELEIRRSHLRVFTEVNLGQLVTGWTKPRFRQSRCDALLCGRDGAPLLVLEFDGETHRKAEKHDSDLERDGLLAGAGLAVLRISSQNKGLTFPHRERNPIQDIEYGRTLRHRRAIADLLTYLVETTADLYIADQCDRARREAAIEEFIARWKKRKAAAEARGTTVPSLADALEDYSANEGLECLIDDASARHELELGRKRLVHRALADAGVEAGSVTVEKVDQDCLRVSGNMLRAGVAHTVHLDVFVRFLCPRSHPLLRLFSLGTDTTKLQDMLRSKLIADAASLVFAASLVARR